VIAAAQLAGKEKIAWENSRFVQVGGLTVEFDEEGHFVQIVNQCDSNHNAELSE
jgi:hypothetical protein